MFILVNPKLGKIWSNTLTINNMYFRFNNHAYKIVARTTDDFGVTTETGIDWVYGNVAIHQYEHNKLGTPINDTYHVQDLDANHKPTGILVY